MQLISPVLRGFFSGYYGVPPFLKSAERRHLKATDLSVSILLSRVTLRKFFVNSLERGISHRTRNILKKTLKNTLRKKTFQMNVTNGARTLNITHVR